MLTHANELLSGEKQLSNGVTVIAKPTHTCNLKCKYCYVHSHAEQGLMDDITTANMIRRIAKYNQTVGHTQIIWHGGDPLLAGIEFYEKVLDIQKEP